MPRRHAAVDLARPGRANALIIPELEADVATRRLADGRPVREAWTLERRVLPPSTVATPPLSRSNQTA